jgi:hypothetical protein
MEAEASLPWSHRTEISKEKFYFNESISVGFLVNKKTSFLGTREDTIML